MFHLKHHAHGTFYYLKNKELDELYISFALKTLAIALINIFVPVYLLQIGFSVVDIISYYLIYYLAISFLAPFGSLLNSKIGVKKGMAFGTVFLVFHFFALNQVSTGLHFAIPALLYGINTAIYWPGFHFEFTSFVDKKREARQMSVINIVALAVSALAPLLGAIFISEISYTFLFLVVMVLLVLSIIPLFFTKDIKGDRPDFSFKKIIKADTKEKGLAYIGLGVLATSLLIFWPLFIYLELKTVLSLGVIVTLTSILMIFYTYLVGKWADKHKRKILKLGIVTHSLSWISRLFFLSPMGLFLNNIFSSASVTLLDLPFNKLTYEGARKSKNKANYFMFREAALGIGRASMLVLALFVFNLKLLFILTFFIVFLFALPLKNLKKQS